MTNKQSNKVLRLPKNLQNNVELSSAMKMKVGDKCTIKGLRQRKDGSYTLRCRPGNETVFIVRCIVDEPAKIPVIAKIKK